MVMPWTRLELDARDDTLAEGLRAEIHDPLWMLARQWQLGELRGEDVGTPVIVDCRTGADAPQVLLAGGEAVTLPPGGDPLESRIEREGPQPPDIATRLLGGALFIELLLARRLGVVAKRCALRFKAVPQGDDDAAAVMALATAPDGEALRTAARAGSAALARELKVTRAQDAAFADAVAQWLQWYGARCGDGGGLAFKADDVAHDATVRTRAGVELAAIDHEGGALEWNALDARAGPPADEALVVQSDARFVPLPMQIPGTGSLRFWEMEDAQVDLGTLAAGSTEVARMLLSSFALMWGHDWFSVPLPLRCGALATVREVTVIDTFGIATVLPAARAGDGFGLWRHKGLAAAAQGFWVPEGATVGTEAPIDRLDIFFDEGGNRLWASETRLVDGLHRPLDGPRPQPPAPPAATPGVWRYRPFTPPPPGWVPLAVVDGTLRLARLALDDVPTPPLHTPMAQTLALRADHVRTEGLTLQRQWEVVRRRDGQLVAWIARRRQALPPTTVAALVFDKLER